MKKHKMPILFMVLFAMFMCSTTYAVDKGTILSGEAKTGTIVNPAQTDSSTFSGNTGQTVVINMSRESGGLNPYIFLYSPDGTLEVSAGPECCYWDHAVIQEHQLAQSGIYTIVLRDNNGRDTGDYSLSFLLIPSATVSSQDPDGGNISSGQTITGRIDPRADTDAYTFTGDVGQAVVINMSRESGGLNPYIFLYSPDGTLEVSAGPECCYWDHAVIQEHQLAQSGIYTIVLRDNNGRDTGDYSLSLTIIGQPANQPPVIDLFAGDPSTGDAPLEVAFTCTSHDPDGTIASYQWDFDGDGNIDQTTSDGTVTYTYADAGTYQAKVTVVDDGGASTVSNAVTISVGANQQTASLILSEDFEDGILDSRISIETIGTFNSNPGIKDITNFGSTKAFGYGRSTCGANCWDNYVTNFKITLPEPTYIATISFKEMELYGNWGSGGKVYIDGVRIPHNLQYDFGRLPNNDGQLDTTYREKSFSVNQYVTTIELKVRDITSSSEIFIDDLEISGAEIPIIDSFIANSTSGDAPLEVAFTCTSHDPDGTIASYQWDFDGDGNIDQTTSDGTVTYTYADAGTYQAKVTVVDDGGASTVSNPVTITVAGQANQHPVWVQLDLNGNLSYGMGCTYDSNRNRGIIFGGSYSTGTIHNDTYEWDGTSWTLITSGGPSPRTSIAAGMAFDSSCNKTVLFGGWVTPDNYYGDTWEWDGTQWSEVQILGPHARANHAMAYDSSREKIVLFGGSCYQTIYGDTWEYDGTSWTQVSSSGPSPRIFPNMVYDKARGKVVLFGGQTTYYGTFLSDTWEWDGSSWQQVATSGPSGRSAHAMAYDPVRQRVILFGGGGWGRDEKFDDTWEWDGNSWTKIEEYGPSARTYAGMFFDEIRQSIILTGGSGPNGNVGDTWEYSSAGQGNPTPQHYFCSQTCEAQCNGDVGCTVECSQYQQDCCQDGLDICEPQCPLVDPPSVHRVGFCDQDCQADAPLKVSGGKLDVCFNYTGPVNILAGVLSEDFKHIWWLSPDCSLDSNYSQAVDSGNGLSCQGTSMPVEEGYLFWLVTSEDFSQLDWEKGVYELLFYQVP